MQVRLMPCLEVDDVPLGLGRADVDVEGVDLNRDVDDGDTNTCFGSYNGLPEVLGHERFFSRTGCHRGSTPGTRS